MPERGRQQHVPLREEAPSRRLTTLVWSSAASTWSPLSAAPYRHIAYVAGSRLSRRRLAAERGGEGVDAVRRVGAPHVDHALQERLPVDGRARPARPRGRGRPAPRGRLRGGGVLRVLRRAVPRLRAERDPQPAGIAEALVEIRVLGRRQQRRARRLGPVQVRRAAPPSRARCARRRTAPPSPTAARRRRGRTRCGRADGFSPTTPQQAAGMRIEPPPSDASAIGTMPAPPRRPRRPTSRRPRAPPTTASRSGRRTPSRWCP